MAAPHVSIVDNPYHYSFKLCSETINSANHYSDSVYSSYLNATTNTEFHCDQCDRSFRSNSQLQSHISEHVVCNTNGCKFTAHPKIISAHIRMQHQSGLFNQIKKLDNPEEIKKWLAERKRKYPTQENISKQAKLNNAKAQRGEVINSIKSRFNKNFKSRGSNRKRKQRNKTPATEETLNSVKKSVCLEVATKRNGDLPEFGGTGCIYDEPEETKCSLNFHISDEEEVAEERCIASEEVQPMNKSLALLMASYDSEDETADITAVTNSIKTTSTYISDPVAESDIDTPEEVKNVTRGTGGGEVHDKSYKRFPKSSKRNNFKTLPRHASNVRKRKPTLLQKLLESQIVKERNVIMESTRFIVKNDFFLDNKDDDAVDEIVTTNLNIKPQPALIPNGSKNKDASAAISIKKHRLLKGLLQTEIINEQNVALQCIRHIVKNNFLVSK